MRFMTPRIIGLVGIALAVTGTEARAHPQQEGPGEGVWRNYDFVPGDTVWKATDFSTEPVGRFPASQLEFVSGNMQIVELEGEKALEASTGSVFRLGLPRDLADDFTLEFQLRIPAPNIGTYVYFSPMTTSVARYPHDYLFIYGRPGVYRKGTEVSNMQLQRIQNRWLPVKLQVDSAYAILYVGSDRVAQVPTANFARSRVVEFHMNGNQRFPSYVKNIVLAVGLNKLYDALVRTGEFTTRGILFDTDSDKLQPESTPVLEEIRKALEEHPDLKIAVEGHTDSQGEDAHNQQLSEQRARAVVAYLRAHGVAGERLTATGKGESAPMADNGTAEGRQQNRRVVIRRGR